MTPIQVVEAYKAILELSKSVFPYKESRKIAKLKKALKDEYEAVIELEENMAKKYGGTKEGNGVIKFPSADDKEAFDKEHNAYIQEEADIKLPAVDISKYTDQLKISPDSVFALDGIVKFEKGEADGRQTD